MRMRRTVRTSGIVTLVAALVAGLCNPAVIAHALGGAGTSGSPYEITSCDDFLDIENDYSAYYTLMNDIDCSADGDSMTVGDNVLAFSGHLDGNHKTITVDINNTSYSYDTAGIFNYTAGATIFDLTIAGSITTNVSTGALTGFDEYSNIHDVVVTAAVSGDNRTGGLIGESQNGTITHIHVNGNVSGSTGTGGIVGYATATTLEDSRYAGDVTGGESTGGLVGYASDCFVRRSGSAGSVTGGDLVGGAVGREAGVTAIEQTTSTSSIHAFQYAGGLVGQMLNTSSIHNSYARGDVTATYYAAGVAGNTAGANAISNVYTTGLVTSGSAKGIVSVDTGGSTITDSIWNERSGANPPDTSGTFAVGLVASQTTDAMTLYPLYNTHPSLSAPWNFETIWGMNETDNDGYPFLLWQGWTSDPPRDRDGIPSSVEDAAPNGGDANNDGTPDAEQDNVVSFVSTVSNKYVAVALSEECAHRHASSAGEAAHSTADPGFSYPAGFIDFAASCPAPSFTANVQAYFYDIADIASPAVRKYTPSSEAYCTIDGAAFTKQTIGGKGTYAASYRVTDGGPLDTDGIADGIITDPVGLGVAAVSAPNTGLGRTFLGLVAAPNI